MLQPMRRAAAGGGGEGQRLDCAVLQADRLPALPTPLMGAQWLQSRSGVPSVVLRCVCVWISSVPPTYHPQPAAAAAAAAWLSRSRDCRLPGLIPLRPSALITQHTHAHTHVQMLSHVMTLLEAS